MPQNLPTELLLDEYHSANRPFMQSVNHLKALLVTHERQCNYKHTRIAKARQRGLTTKENAEENGVAAQTVLNTLKRPEIAKLLDLMTHYAQLWEGPTIQERKREIWEIAVDNKKLDPRTSLMAHKELNHIEGVGKQDPSTGINITINSNIFQESALDAGIS